MNKTKSKINSIWCEYCGKEYKSKSWLLKHLNSKHQQQQQLAPTQPQTDTREATKKNETQYKCKCEQIFVYKKSFQKQLNICNKINTNEKNEFEFCIKNNLINNFLDKFLLTNDCIFTNNPLIILM
jgi:hypothetical protein